MTPQQFVQDLTAVSFENTFNPYRDRCAVHDRYNAPILRRKALCAILERASEADIDAIWIGRDLGYRGGRRTGLALTDDVHLRAHCERWGITTAIPTKGEIVAERTAAVIWRVLLQVSAPVFLWNVFPFHPHESANQFSNRSHSASERRMGEELLVVLIALLRPRRLIAVGNDAAWSVHRLGLTTTVAKVRHPSYGGQTQFLRSMRELYLLPNVD